MTFASFLSLSTSSATSATFPPPARSWGGARKGRRTFGLVAAPRESAGITFISFFFAFMIPGRDAYRGSFSRRSVVITAGSVTPIVSRSPHRRPHHAGNPQTAQSLRRLQENCTGRPHGQGGSDLLLALLRADRQDHHLPAPLLLDPEGLLHRDLAERGDHHLHVLQDDSAPVLSDLHLVVGVGARPV